MSVLRYSCDLWTTTDEPTGTKKAGGCCFPGCGTSLFLSFCLCLCLCLTCSFVVHPDVLLAGWLAGWYRKRATVLWLRENAKEGHEPRIELQVLHGILRIICLVRFVLCSAVGKVVDGQHAAAVEESKGPSTYLSFDEYYLHFPTPSTLACLASSPTKSNVQHKMNLVDHGLPHISTEQTVLTL